MDTDYLSADSLPADTLSVLANTWHIELQAPNYGAVVALCFALFLLFVSALISASEVAFFSLSPTDHEAIEEEETEADSIIMNLLRKSERLMAAILIGNNLVNVAIIMLFSFFMSHIMVSVSPLMNFLLQTVILTFLLLLFGEIMPKVYASHNPLIFARRMSGMMNAMVHLFRPFISLLVHSTGAINRHIAPHVSENVSIDDLSDALKLSNQVVKDKEEKKMLEDIINFGNKTVMDAMTSRMDMTTLEIDTPFGDVLKLVIDTNYSRIPVYEGTEDHIKGILYIKDLLPYLNQNNDFKWQNLIRPAYYVPESKMIDDLLDDFRRKHMHMAIVVDEFGGTSGLITMEDVLEEIVGEICDEYDEEETTWQKIGHNEWIFEARTPLNDFYKVTGIDSAEFEDISENCESIGGLILEIKGDFPCAKETIRFGRYEFTVIAMARRRIDRVHFKIKPEGGTN